MFSGLLIAPRIHPLTPGLGACVCFDLVDLQDKSCLPLECPNPLYYSARRRIERRRAPLEDDLHGLTVHDDDEPCYGTSGKSRSEFGMILELQDCPACGQYLSLMRFARIRNSEGTARLDFMIASPVRAAAGVRLVAEARVREQRNVFELHLHPPFLQVLGRVATYRFRRLLNANA
jgi:hypothetical protein